MENKRKIAFGSVIVLALLAAMLVAIPPMLADIPPSTNHDANATWFDPKTVNASYCEYKDVDVYINTSVGANTFSGVFDYTCCCANVTNATCNTTNFGGSGGYCTINYATCGNVIISAATAAGTTTTPNQPVHVATLTLHCCNTSGCETNLTWDLSNSYVTGLGGAITPTIWHNGTVNCTGMPDLNVSKITVNPDFPKLCDWAFGPTNHTGARTQCNNISAVIEEDEGVAVNNFDVLFRVTNKTTGAVVADCPQTGLNLAGGDNLTVWCNCTWRPFAYEDYTINVTVDPLNATAETDENNNTMVRDVTPQVNGFKGNHFQDGRNISKLQCDTGHINLTYSVGDSSKNGSLDLKNANGTYLANWTTADLPVPASANIEKARLYVYYNWDKTNNSNVYENFTLKFNNTEITRDAVHMDMKCPGCPCPVPPCQSNATCKMCHYDCGYGMVAYNVTGEFNKMGTNRANLTLDPDIWQNRKTSMTGMLLAVVYESSSEPSRIICINEGFDMLLAGTYWGVDYGTTSEEATTYANFTGENIPVNFVTNAKLVTITNHAEGDGDDRLYFNGKLLGNESWPYARATEIGINETAVSISNLTANDNTATFQSYKASPDGDLFEATNAFLVVEMLPVLIGVEPKDTIVQPQDQFEINITIDTGDINVSGVEYYLLYNSSVIWAETQNKGPFLGNYSETWVGQNVIDNPNGVIHYAEARKGEFGVAGKGTLSTIQFTATGARGDISHLNLTGVIIVKEDKNETTYIIENGTVKINDNIPPVAKATLKHRTNNCAKKYQSWTKLCACKSYDPDEGKGGNISYVRWDFGDGQYGTSEGEFVENCTEGVNCTGCQKNHSYKSWRWEPFGALPPPAGTGHYVPFEAVLTVRDDGCPEEEDNDHLNVTIYIAGDANGDGRVNVLDAVYVGKHWDEECDDGIHTWPPQRCCWYWTDERVQQDKADLNNDCKVNILDAVRIGAMWGHTAW